MTQTSRKAIDNWNKRHAGNTTNQSPPDLLTLRTCQDKYFDVTLLEGGKSVGGLVAGWLTPGGRPVEAGVHGFWCVENELHSGDAHDFTS